MIDVGFYKGTVMDKAIGTTKKGLPQLVLRLLPEFRYDGGADDWEPYSPDEEVQPITAYLVLISGAGEPIFHAKDVMRVFGWTGQSFADLEDMDVEGKVVTFEVNENYYNDNVTMQVQRIDTEDATPAGLQRLDPADVKDLDANFKMALLSLGGSKAPKKATAKKSPKKATAKKAPKKSPTKDAPAKSPPSRKSTDAGSPVVDAITAWEEVDKAARKVGEGHEAVQENWWKAIATVAGKHDMKQDSPEEDFDAKQWQEVVEEVINEIEIPF